MGSARGTWSIRRATPTATARCGSCSGWCRPGCASTFFSAVDPQATEASKAEAVAEEAYAAACADLDVKTEGIAKPFFAESAHERAHAASAKGGASVAAMRAKSTRGLLKGGGGGSTAAAAVSGAPKTHGSDAAYALNRGRAARARASTRIGLAAQQVRSRPPSARDRRPCARAPAAHARALHFWVGARVRAAP